MSTKYTVDYFINKFKKISKDRWCIGEFRKGSRKCAFGHCGTYWDEYGAEIQTEEGEALKELFRCHFGFSFRGPDINDVRSFHYPQKSAKARILAALKDIKEQNENT